MIPIELMHSLEERGGVIPEGATHFSLFNKAFYGKVGGVWSYNHILRNCVWHVSKVKKDNLGFKFIPLTMDLILELIEEGHVK